MSLNKLANNHSLSTISFSSVQCVWHNLKLETFNSFKFFGIQFLHMILSYDGFIDFSWSIRKINQIELKFGLFLDAKRSKTLKLLTFNKIEIRLCHRSQNLPITLLRKMVLVELKSRVTLMSPNVKIPSNHRAMLGHRLERLAEII